jgi:hypothetical protein
MTCFEEQSFDHYAIPGETIECECDGFRLVATIHHDDHMGAPWEEHDGHGTVSDWTTRAKRPGELVAAEDRGSFRYYDFAEACRIALRDGWNAAPYVIDGETRRQQAARAARHDYAVMRAWCDDEWTWCGIVVTAYADDIELASESLWGIELNYPGGDNIYLREVASELAEQAIDAAKAKLAELVEAFA